MTHIPGCGQYDICALREALPVYPVWAYSESGLPDVGLCIQSGPRTHTHRDAWPQSEAIAVISRGVSVFLSAGRDQIRRRHAAVRFNHFVV